MTTSISVRACPCVRGRLVCSRPRPACCSRLARAYGDGWFHGGRGLPVRTGTVGDGAVGDGRDGSRPRLRLARAYGDGWGRRPVVGLDIEDCPCVRGRLVYLHATAVYAAGLPVRTGTGWRRLTFAARAVPDCPCVRGRLAEIFVWAPSRWRLARAYGDGWCTSMRPYNS
jgi:hypothetical protein